MSCWPGRSKHAKTTFGGLSRSALMSRVRSKRNATTELRLVSLLRSARLRGWRRDFPLLGRPDFVFPEARLAVFVDGCFWHGHSCGRNLKPKRNVALWQEKILGNQRRDRRNARRLRAAGWHVIRIWECALAKNPRSCVRRIERVVSSSVHAVRLGLIQLQPERFAGLTRRLPKALDSNKPPGRGPTGSRRSRRNAQS